MENRKEEQKVEEAVVRREVKELLENVIEDAMDCICKMKEQKKVRLEEKRTCEEKAHAL